jgi:hypothetical protein
MSTQEDYRRDIEDVRDRLDSIHAAMAGSELGTRFGVGVGIGVATTSKTLSDKDGSARTCSNDHWLPK